MVKAKSVELSILELAVTFTALEERIERLKKIPNPENDIQLFGEIESSEAARSKIKQMYLAKGGPANLL